MIRLVAVSKRVPAPSDAPPLLDDVTLHARAGELLVLLGGRGAGKSTVLRIAAGIERPDAGQVWIAGREVSRLQEAALPYVRRNVGYLPGDAPLLPRESALENVMLPLGVRGESPKEARRKALAALERFGVQGCAGKRTEALSTGERRLVAMARTIAGDPPVMLLDDPAAGLPSSDLGILLSAVLGAVEAGASVLCACPEGPFATAAVRAGGRRVRLAEGRLEGGARPTVVGGTPRPVSPAATEPSPAPAAAEGVGEG